MAVHPGFRQASVVELALGLCTAIGLAFLETVPIVITYSGPLCTRLANVLILAIRAILASTDV